MNVSTRFTVALHILTLLALCRQAPVTSGFIASSVNTNPVFIRRLLAGLRRRGFVASQPGSGGGWSLAVDPAQITLAGVRRAMEEGSPFSMHSQSPNPACPVGRNIQRVLGGVFQRAEAALERELDQTSIAALLRGVKRRA